MRPRFPLLPFAALFILLLLLPPDGYAAANPLPPGGSSIQTTSSAAGRTCLDNASAPLVTPNLRVALVEPVFTATPYSSYEGYRPGSFYTFYQKYANTKGNITTDLGLLRTPVSAGEAYQGGWGQSIHLYRFMSSPAAQACGLTVGRNVAVLSDINVSEGALFGSGGSVKFDVAVIGFAEYVTLQEYAQLQRFVANGGRLVLMGGDDLAVQVNYDPSTGNETYVAGHGFEFDGETAWKSPVMPFEQNNTDWLGSNYCCFHRFSYVGAAVNPGNPVGASLAAQFGATVFTEYSSHEEASLTNGSMTTVIATFADSNGTVVAAYTHRYGRGSVVCMCIFADDIIESSPSAQYFLVLAISTGDLWTVGAGTPAAYYLVSVAAAGAGILAFAAYAYRRRQRLPGRPGDPSARAPKTHFCS